MSWELDDFDREEVAYVPTADDQARMRLVEDRWEVGQQNRRPHEGDWFVVGAFLRGHQRVEWSQNDGKLITPPSPRSTVPVTINMMQPKDRARKAKFLKNRPVPTVRPATNDLKDRLDARGTTKALEFAWRKGQLEAKYALALNWARITDHGYWWFSWNPTSQARLAVKDEMTGESQVHIAPVGDLDVEVGSPFEVVVADPTLPFIGMQPWIIRIKRRALSFCEARFKQKAKFIKPDGEEISGEAAGDRYAQQLGRLASTGNGIGLALSPAQSNDGKGKGEPWVLIKEYFEKPCAEYPKGRYMVVGGGVLLRMQDEIPYFSDFETNPYPCVDFQDFEQAGQYWGTTINAQAVPIQREYNNLRTGVGDHNRLMKHPKLLAYRQHNLAPGTWTNRAGEVIIANWVPGLPPVTPWVPPPINADVWRTLEMCKVELDDIYQIYPESEGQVGKSTSGFQTNLMQEANDAVHTPDIRAHERCIEEAAYKIRRLMKLGYSPSRLLTVMGKSMEPEVFEFHRDDIDEAAEIVVEAASALPQLKAARMQAVMEMWTAGLLGDPADPAARQKALAMLEMGTNEDIYDSARRDEEFAMLENRQFEDGVQVQAPEFYQNHDVHYRVHTDALKSASAGMWPVERQIAIRRHIIEHIFFVNPNAAMEHAMRYGFEDLAQRFMLEAQQAAMMAPPPQSGATQDAGAPAPPPGQGAPAPGM